MFPTQRRRQLFVNAKLQGTLLAHAAIYWFYCLLSIILIACCWTVFVQRPATSTELFGIVWINFGPAMLGSLILLPLVLFDCLRLSNRFAGPMVRIHRAMKRLADGEPVDPIKLRDDDFWVEFTDDLNRVAVRMSAAKGQTAGSARGNSEDTASPEERPIAATLPSPAPATCSEIPV